MATSKPNKDDKGKLSSFADGIKYLMEKLGSVNISSIFRTTLILLNLLVIIFLYNVVSSQQTVEKIIDNAVDIIQADREDEIDLDIRDHVTPQISSDLKKLLYALDADRACVIELHNGKKNATSLPFKYFDMTYEEINDNKSVTYISQNFMSIMVSHYKLPYYIVDNHMFVGSSEDLANVDPRFASNFEKYGGKFMGMVILRNDGKNIGFLAIAYNDTKSIHSNEDIEDKLTYYSKIIAPLLDLGTQKIKFNPYKVNESYL